MKLSDVREYIKANLPDTTVYIGRLGSDEENTVALYARETSLNTVAIGGRMNTGCGVLGIKILVHGSQNAVMTELFANKVYDLFYAVINSGFWCNVKQDAPISVGADSNNIYEYVINVDLWYNV
jgi:hypothetical protein